MNSISFPNMFEKGSKTALIEGKDASVQNVRLALMSPKDSMIGDPEFGSLLKHRLFSQNSIILKDLVIDDIYSTIRAFVPQVILKRSDIRIDAKDDIIYATINCKSSQDYENNTFVINLTT